MMRMAMGARAVSLLILSATVLLAPAAMASTVTLTFSDYLTSGQYAGQTSPIAMASITDFGTNEVRVTLTPELMNDSDPVNAAPQVITGLWLNLGASGIGPAAVSVTQDASATYNPLVSSSY